MKVTCDVCGDTDEDYKLMLHKFYSPERMQCIDCSAKQDGAKYKMTNDPSKPREFWVGTELGKEHEQNGSWSSQIFTKSSDVLLHVIEYSAYEELQAKYNFMVDSAQQNARERDELHEELRQREMATPTMHAVQMLTRENAELQAELELLRNQTFDGKYHDTLRSDYDMLKAELADARAIVERQYNTIIRLNDKWEASEAEVARLQSENYCPKHEVNWTANQALQCPICQDEYRELAKIVASETVRRIDYIKKIQLRERQLEIARKFIDGCMVDGIDGAASYDLAIEALEREANDPNGIRNPKGI